MSLKTRKARCNFRPPERALGALTELSGALTSNRMDVNRMDVNRMDTYCG